ncbi:hypothetical protein MPC4_60091 [Methylocella tundrae]|uniref:Uncharacterized protein n=1 Tax=Methylocella tundrae TaxID=227605 RepID=A0A8B6MAT4_METTU|nr:hypothetical protein [Methylocella tundrae]VTZ52002.1 hypothetical protein MPC4_60091 [Methylocella tundrae]
MPSYLFVVGLGLTDGVLYQAAMAGGSGEAYLSTSTSAVFGKLGLPFAVALDAGSLVYGVSAGQDAQIGSSESTNGSIDTSGAASDTPLGDAAIPDFSQQVQSAFDWRSHVQTPGIALRLEGGDRQRQLEKTLKNRLASLGPGAFRDAIATVRADRVNRVWSLGSSPAGSPHRQQSRGRTRPRSVCAACLQINRHGCTPGRHERAQ